MKRLGLCLCLLVSANVFANTIIGFSPNDGSGDNFGFIIYGNNSFFAGGGGAPADFFNTLGYAPGSVIGGDTTLFMSGGFARIGPNSSEISFDLGSLSMGLITLPTNGKDFRASVGISFDAPGTLLTTGESIDLGGSANGHIQFRFVDGLYYADPLGFIQTPEPGTLGLLSIGLIGIISRLRHKRHRTEMN